MTFHLGYGTNGFSNHRLDDALAVIADLGYTGVALTLDHDHLDPFADDLAQRVDHVAARLSTLGLNRVVIETGARYLLDPWHKHSPTLLSHEPEPRIDFLARALRIAADLDADCVSFWSGVSTVDVDLAWVRLREHAERLNVRLAMEPEPGHLVQHLSQVLDLRTELGEPELFGVTLDVGHCVAVEPADAAECIRLAGPLLWNVQLDDMVPNVPEHLEFGEGQLDLPATLAALDEIGYTGLAAVELPRHSHAAPDVARRSIEASPPRRRADPPPHRGRGRAERRIRELPSGSGALFPAVGREGGRAPLEPDTDPQGLVDGTVDDQARSRLITVLARQLPADELAAELGQLYRYGDDAERRGVLRGLNQLVEDGVIEGKISAAGERIVAEALRANDTRLVSAAMGAFAARHLEPHAWRHGVLKCVFVGVPLAAVASLEARADDELRRMLADFADERRAAGRDVPADAVKLLEEGR